MSDDQATSIASDIATLHGLHVLQQIDDAERGVAVCSECSVRWSGGGDESEGQWLVHNAGGGSLNVFCLACAERRTEGS